MTFQQLIICVGSIFVGFICTVGIGRELVRKAIPAIRIVRSGTQVEGTMVGMQMPAQSGYRTQRPVIRFPGPDGKYLRVHDLRAQKLRKQPGETVLLHYDPADPKGTATSIDLHDAYGYVRSFVIGLVISVAVGVWGILMSVGVLPIP